MTTPSAGITKVRKRLTVLRTRLQRLLLWRAWERMLEIEFVDRSVALAGKAFVSFFPLVIVVAAFVSERARSSIITLVTFRLGMRGDTFTLAREAFASSDDIRKATGLLGLVLAIFFATLVHDCAAARVPPCMAATAPSRGRSVLAWRDLAAGDAGVSRRTRRVARCPRRRARGRPVRHRVIGGDGGAVVVHGVVPPAGRRAGAGAVAHRCDHRPRVGRVRSIGPDLDARPGGGQRCPVRLLRCRPRVGDLVLRRRDLRLDRRMRRIGLRRGHRASRQADPRRPVSDAHRRRTPAAARHPHTSSVCAMRSTAPTARDHCRET